MTSVRVIALSLVKMMLLGLLVSVALVSGISEGFEGIGDKLQQKYHLSDTIVTLLLGSGLIGIYISLPAGIVTDKLGPEIVILLGGGLTSFSLASIIFIPKHLWPILFISMGGMGLGSGATLTAALSAAVQLYPGHPAVAVGIVEIGMALSMGFPQILLLLIDLLSSQVNINLIVLSSIIFSISALVGVSFISKGWIVYSYKRSTPVEEEDPVYIEDSFEGKKVYYESPDYELGILDYVLCFWRYPAALVLEQQDIVRERYQSQPRLSFFQSFFVIKKPIFLLVLWGYALGVGSGLMVATSAQKIWLSYADTTYDHWSSYIILCFMLANITGSVCTGILADTTHDVLPKHWVYAIGLGLTSLVYFPLSLLAFFPSHSPYIHIVYYLTLSSTGLFFAWNITLMPAVVESIFNAKNFGVIFSYGQTGAVFSVILIPVLSVWVSSFLHNSFWLPFAVLGVLHLATSSLLFLIPIT